jgi:hypothetical protein
MHQSEEEFSAGHYGDSPFRLTLLAICISKDHRLDDKKRLESSCLAQMAIYKLNINAMTAAYESALVEIGMVDRDDPLTEMLAKSILTVTATGERDPEKIKERALHALRISRGGTA